MLKQFAEYLAESQTIKSISENMKSGLPIITMPESYKIENIEKYSEHRARFRGEYSTSSITDFASYAEDHHGNTQPTCFIDSDAMKARMIFDLGTIEQPLHCDDVALLSLVRTSEFNAILSLHGIKTNQKELVQFLIDWKENVSCYGDIDDEGDSESMPFSKAIGSIRRITIKSSADAESEVKNFAASSSVISRVSAESANGMVGGFKFRFKPYDELDEVEFDIRLSLNTDGVVTFTPRIRLKEKRMSDIAENFQNALQAALGEGTPVYLGNFSSK